MAKSKLTAPEARIAKKILSVTSYTEHEAGRCAQRILSKVARGGRLVFAD